MCNQAGNSHKEHRERMRRRYLLEGLDSFAEHEVLELLLFFSIPQKNTNDLAHSLMDRFGSLSAVLAASPLELRQVKGIGERSAVLLNLVPQICLKARLAPGKRVLKNLEQIAAFLLDYYAGEKREVVCLLCLNRRGRLLSCNRIREGALSAADLDVREIAKSAILDSADQVILSHNHPSGLALPSGSDYEATDRIKAALDTLNIPLRDHIIVAGRDYVSLRESGYLR